MLTMKAKFYIYTNNFRGPRKNVGKSKKKIIFYQKRACIKLKLQN